MSLPQVLLYLRTFVVSPLIQILSSPPRQAQVLSGGKLPPLISLRIKRPGTRKAAGVPPDPDILGQKQEPFMSLRHFTM
jgi:hypothetical protein